MLYFRWWILGTVVLLNLANYAHWIAFPAVAKKVHTKHNPHEYILFQIKLNF